MRRWCGWPAVRRTGAGAMPRRLAAFVPLLLAAACGRSPDRPNEDAPRLYVTSGFTDEVHVLDARDGTTLRTISLDRRRTETDEPHGGVTVSPDGRHWYATLAQGHPTLWKYETAGDRLVGRLPLEIPARRAWNSRPTAAAPSFRTTGGAAWGRRAAWPWWTSTT